MVSPQASDSAAAPFLDAVKNRRTVYAINDQSPIPDSRIQEIVEFTIKHSPSAFNVQSARAIILFGEQHKKLWNDIACKHMSVAMPADKWAGFEPRVKGYAAGHGTVMFFEDEEALESLGNKQPMVKSMLTEWSTHSQGIHHFNVWTALEAEGLGASLQHFNFHPLITKDIKETWGLPETWKPHAQLVFGTPTADPSEKSFEPLEHRVRVFA